MNLNVNNTDQQYHAKDKKIVQTNSKKKELEAWLEAIRAQKEPSGHQVVQRKNNGSEDKQKKYDEKISQPTTISVHTQKMANTNLKNKPYCNFI